MRSGPWILLLLACGVITAILQLWSGQARETPMALLDSAIERLESKDPNYSLALHELTRGIELLERDLASDDPAVVAEARQVGSEILARRASLHKLRANWGLAQRDATRAVEEFDGNPGELLSEACLCALNAGRETEALTLAERLIREAPGEAVGLAYRGAARLAMVRKVTDQVATLLASELPEAQVETVLPQVRRAMALGPDSPLFEAALEAVALHFDSPSSRDNAIEVIRRGATWLRSARRDFVDSMGIEPIIVATEGFQEILFKAGKQKNAAVFGRLLLDLPQVQLPSATLLRTIEAWIGLEQPDRARALLANVQKVQPQALNFRLVDHLSYERWALALYRLEEWSKLAEIGSKFWDRKWMIVDQDERDRFIAMGQLYTLLGTSAQGLSWAKHLGKIYLDYDGPPPFVGAKLAVYLATAKIARLEKNVNAENLAVQAATDFAGVSAPDYLREDLGRAWLERANSYAKNSQAVNEEAALAKAMTVWPPLRIELEERWRAAGERAYTEIRRNHLSKRAEYVSLQVYTPEIQLSALESTDIAQAFFNAGDLFGAHAYLDHCFLQYPNFPVALQLRAEFSFRAEDYEQAAEAGLQLLESGGGTLAHVKSLVEIPIDKLPGDLGIRWYRAVPHKHALLAMLDRLPTDQKKKLLLSSLLRENATRRLRDDSLERAAALCVELGRWDEALELLSRMKPADREYASLAGTKFLSMLNAKGAPATLTARLTALVKEIESAEEVDPLGFADAIDQLHGSARIELAKRLANAVREKATVRPSEVYLRDGVQALIDGDWQTTRQRLVEASFDIEPRRIDFGRLAIGLQNEEWEDARAAARDLERLDGVFDSFERSLLLGLRGGRTQLLRALEYLDLEPAAFGTPEPFAPLVRMCLEALLKEPESTWDHDPLARVDGRPFIDVTGGPTDPRQILALLLAMRLDGWDAWALHRISELPPAQRKSAWGVAMFAGVTHRLGNDELALKILDAITGPKSIQFASGWYLRERIVLDQVAGDVSAESFVGTRGLRTLAVGSEGIGAFESELVAMHMDEWNEDYESAVERLESLVSVRPADYDLKAKLAANLKRLGRNVEAVELLREVLERKDDLAFEQIPVFLDTLNRATDQDGTINERARYALLESLELEFPDDPAIVRERAHLQIKTSDSDLYGIARAWELLDLFRRRTSEKSIDDMREGEAEQWLEMFLRYDPVRARAFAETELFTNPASPDSRWMWARVLAESGEMQAAVKELERSTAAVSHPPSLRLYAQLLAELGEPAGRVASLLAATRVAEGLRRQDPELIYISAVANLNGKNRDKSIDDLALLWMGRETIRDQIDIRDVGMYLAQAYLRRSTNDDCLRAGAILDELLLAEREPVSRDFLRAMAHLARHHAPRALRDGLAPPPSEADVAERFSAVTR